MNSKSATPTRKDPDAMGSRLRQVASLLRSNREATLGAVIVLAFAVTSLVVEAGNLLNLQVVPYSPIKQNVGPLLASPSWAHPFGTDSLGRDLFSRIIYAMPNDVAVGYVVVASALAVGSVLGSFAGIRGGIADELLMRFTDVFFALPVLVLAMVIALLLGAGVTNMMIVLAIVWWPPYARLARGEALKVAHQNYIEAARLSGLGARKLIFEHVIPNISGTLLVYATLDIGTVILTYSGLAYVGLAVRYPYPDWGLMVSDYNTYVLSAPWLPLFPGLMISLGVIGFSLLGDGIKETMEKR
ncbi:MAG TPA: ABC transporter permease [Nitrososphaerales archaeon]|nr:ABC transporter permease [Nitrososphaerales archaeon]